MFKKDQYVKCIKESEVYTIASWYGTVGEVYRVTADQSRDSEDKVSLDIDGPRVVFSSRFRALGVLEQKLLDQTLELKRELSESQKATQAAKDDHLRDTTDLNKRVTDAEAEVNRLNLLIVEKSLRDLNTHSILTESHNILQALIVLRNTGVQITDPFEAVRYVAEDLLSPAISQLEDSNRTLLKGDAR